MADLVVEEAPSLEQITVVIVELAPTWNLVFVTTLCLYLNHECEVPFISVYVLGRVQV